MEIALIILGMLSAFLFSMAVFSFIRSAMESNRRNKVANLKQSSFCIKMSMAVVFICSVLSTAPSDSMGIRAVFLMVWLVGVVVCTLAYETNRARWNMLQIIWWPITLLLTGYRKITKV